MKTVLVIIAVVVSLLAAFMLLNRPEQLDDHAFTNLPWQIETLPGGLSRVFGITLGKSTLGDVRKRLGPETQMAIVVSADAGTGLEMFYKHYSAGPFSGKLVVEAQVEPAQLKTLVEQAVKREHMDSGALKFTLSASDTEKAYRIQVASIAFIPAAKLDENTAVQRFGKPARTIQLDGQMHLLYPLQGLDLILAEKGRDILQYVAPSDFDRLSQPLEAASGP